MQKWYYEKSYSLSNPGLFLPYHQCVENTEDSLFINPRVPGAEAVHLLARSDAPGVGVLQGQRQQVLQPQVTEHWQGLH